MKINEYFESMRNIFIDFDGVVLIQMNSKKSNEKSIFAIIGKNQKSIDAINYFNINAGLSRHKNFQNF